MSFVEGRFQHGSYEFAYEIHGERGVPCLLLHGLLLDSMMNRDLARRFAAAGYRVVLMDMLGHGRSSRPTDPRELRIDFFAAQALALLDHLGIERAVIGGASLGAITALQIADAAPERCIALFLEMPVMEWSTTFAAILLVPVIGAMDFAKGLVRPFARAVRKLPRPRAEWLASMMNAASSEPEQITAVLHGILVGPVVPPAARRRQFTMPSLIVAHGGDRLHELRDALALSNELPNARLLRATWIGELRHRPERLWNEIEAFFTEVRDGELGVGKRWSVSRAN